MLLQSGSSMHEVRQRGAVNYLQLCAARGPVDMTAVNSNTLARFLHAAPLTQRREGWHCLCMLFLALCLSESI